MLLPLLEGYLGHLANLLKLTKLGNKTVHVWSSRLFSCWIVTPYQNSFWEISFQLSISKQIRRGKCAWGHLYIFKSPTLHTWRHKCVFSQKLRIETVNTLHNNIVYMKYRIVSSLSSSFSVHMLKKARTTNSAHSSPVCTMAAVNQQATTSR